ncbi:DUF2190 domain-containing protein [bacterium (Candidatus Blackallbacteria) CG13_big_fil_rev_8_21_14_2_50_49_14]|nr:MAG: DUF2190 domain-containing protein [bacterium (Candidatus Blackallbacteria) CG18_big_fil_WC_8_21_14_2_50_49_26]PIW46663.1 MAG: DUF2190 domain-containing protein [bacterium (Candidatus Blackallbacteria) CG13_big_fil_rev_8_21_14_2_50_49_14]
MLATAGLTGNRLVSPTGGLPTAGGNTLGVAGMDTSSGQTAPVIAMGTAPIEASAAIAEGAEVEALADGRIVTKSTGVTVGRTLQAATAAGQVIEVLLIPN